MRELTLSKGQALGNDYLVADATELEGRLTEGLIRGACDRHLGLGSDGILVGHLDREPVRLRIYNPDGSEAEKSGNGLRIFGAWLHGRGVVSGEPFPVELPTDTVTMQVEEEHDDGSLGIRVAMGRASFAGADVGFVPEAGEALQSRVDLGDGLEAVVNPVSLGNPHCVVFVESLTREDFEARAPRLVYHPAFAAGTNVQFARVVDEETLEAWIWERGVGETLASGSSSCAVAAAAARLGLVAAAAVTVRMPGGVARLEIGEDFAMTLRGPAQILYEAVVPAAVVAGWASS